MNNSDYANIPFKSGQAIGSQDVDYDQQEREFNSNYGNVLTEPVEPVKIQQIEDEPEQKTKVAVFPKVLKTSSNKTKLNPKRKISFNLGVLSTEGYLLKVSILLEAGVYGLVWTVAKLIKWTVSAEVFNVITMATSPLVISGVVVIAAGLVCRSLIISHDNLKKAYSNLEKEVPAAPKGTVSVSSDVYLQSLSDIKKEVKNTEGSSAKVASIVALVVSYLVVNSLLL